MSRRRSAAATIAASCIALLVSACGGGPSGGPPHAGGSASSRSAVAYAACIRSHGVPKYPDPGSDGSLPKGNARAFGVSSSQYQAAERACRQLLPSGDTAFNASLIQCLENGATDCPQALVQRALDEGRKFARCMRHAGVPSWPDPTIDSLGRPSFQIVRAGISLAATRTPQMLSRIGHCERQTGAPLLRQE